VYVNAIGAVPPHADTLRFVVFFSPTGLVVAENVEMVTGGFTTIDMVAFTNWPAE
jgi:hypothetical protein